MKDEPIRIAQVVGNMCGGGVETFLMNYYKNIDRSKIQFDFIIDEDSTYVPRKEIESLAGKIIELPTYKHIFKYIKELTKIFKENKYKIVHANLNTLNILPLFCAKIAKVPIRISHAHSTTNKKEWKRNFTKIILKYFSRIFANEYFCCTEMAGRWQFGDKYFEEGKIKIIKDAIDTNKFTYNLETRKKVRKKLNIEDKFVIGHIGRFVEQTNHKQLIEIFNEYCKEHKNSVLVLIGDGPLKKKIIKQVNNLNLQNSVLFLGQREDVNELYQAMDLFLFPSLYEGLGMVLVEAQCSGLHCIASTNVPIDAKLTENFSIVSLADNINTWIQEIDKLKEKNSRGEYASYIEKAGYEIKNENEKLLNLYLSLLNNIQEKEEKIIKKEG